MLDIDFRRSLFYPKADLPLPDEVLRSRGNVPLSEPAIAQVCADVLKAKVIAVDALEPGTFHGLWRVQREDGRPAIFKASTLSEWFHDEPLKIDEMVERSLLNEGLPALRVHAVDLSRERCPVDFSIMDEAPGKSLRAFDDDEEKLLPLLDELGKFLAKVHRIEVHGFGLIESCRVGGGFAEPTIGEEVGSAKPPPTLQENRSTPQTAFAGRHSTWGRYIAQNLAAHVKICGEIGAIDDDESQRILSLFEDRGEVFAISKASLLHGDPGNHNIFVENGRITALIDWEDAVAGDPVYEIAFWATFHPEQRHAAFLEGYRSEASLPPDFQVRFWLYFLRVALAKTVLRHRLGVTDKPGREPASRRIQNSLKAVYGLV